MNQNILNSLGAFIKCTKYYLRLVILSALAYGLAGSIHAATFKGEAYLWASDSTGAMSWNTGTAALTVECWFKLSIPSGTNLTDNMTILVNRKNGVQTDPHGYLIWFNCQSGNIEYSCRGASGIYTNTLITRPYLERWYHVAVVRQNDVFTAYVDGRQVFSTSAAVGDSSNTGAMCVGGWGAARYLYGEVQEVAIYQRALSGAEIVDNLFADQSLQPSLTGYFKLGYSTNTVVEFANSAPVPASGIANLTAVGSVTFEETDEAGEQSTFDAQRNGGQDAIVPLSGSFSWEQTAFGRPTPGIAFDFHYGYSSANAFGGYQLGSANPYASGAMGPGWRNTFETRLLPGQDFDPSQGGLVVGLMSWSGAIETWDIQIVDTNSLIYGTKYFTRSKEYRGEMVKHDDLGVFQWTTPERIIYTFRHPFNSPQVMKGRLLKLQDFNGNVVQLQWNQAVGVLTQVVDSVNGTYKLNYNAGYQLTNVTYGQWQVNFSYDTTNRLISKSITNAAGLYGAVNTTWQFQYGTNGLLSRIVDPRGNTNIVVQYDQYGRQTNLTDALNRATITHYGVPGNRQITHIDPATNSWIETYDRKGHILAQQDPLTNTTRYTYDDHGNRVSITEPLGWATFFGYDDRANVIAKTNAMGETTTWSFHPFYNKAVQKITQQPQDEQGWTNWTNYYAYDASGNLTNHADALGILVSYTYTTNGLVLTSTDANGNTTRFSYDENGFLHEKTDPAANTTSYEVNDVGWKLREYDALGNPTSYTYDLNGNATRIQDVLGRVFNKTYDGNGNLISATDGNRQLTTYAFDAANQRTNMVDRTGTNNWSYFYTLCGKMDHVTDPLGNSVTNIYDTANRLVRVADPLGWSITNQYDANGNLIAFHDKLGQQWVKTYDRLNRAISEADPFGNTRITIYNVADRIQQVISPNGYPSTHTYDGRGRLTKWMDPQNYSWLYAYDGVGNITNITDALGGQYIMTYGTRNERLSEQNQDGNRWEYAYDELLRLRQQTDPNGIIRTPTYDFAGRLQFVEFSTGRRDSFIYDDNDNPKSISRRASGVTTSIQFVYDSLDRVIEQDDALQKTVHYGYDSVGQNISITYPDGKHLSNNYDALGRLTNQVDWVGRQTVYAYDAGGRMIYRRYPNGVVQTNVFDVAGRLTELSYSTPNPPATTNQMIQVALTYAYDRNGNKIGSGEKGTLAWPLPSLTDDSSQFTPAGRLINRQTQNNSVVSNQTSTITYRYDASGNMTNASGNVQSWTLTYDEDNRTTSIDWDSGSTSKHIFNRYDAFGRRISKTVDGVTTGYVLSLAGGMERILCELDGNGSVTAWYVHGADLCYRVDATNGLTCYHADAMANVVALTDGNTNLVAQYAYTPYGRSLGVTNLQNQISNPYLYVGSQGVMEELPGLYFMRARYYSADAGVFLSPDPVKNIGPRFKPALYFYANNNPISYVDPNGEVVGFDDAAIFTLALLIYSAADWIYSTAANESSTDSSINGVGTLAAPIGEGLRMAGLKSAPIIGQIATAFTVPFETTTKAFQGKGLIVGVAKASIGSFQWAMGDPITANGGTVGNSTPMLGNSFTPLQAGARAEGLLANKANSGGGGSSANQSISSRTIIAGSYAQSITAQTQTKAAPVSICNGGTTQSIFVSSNTNSGNNAFSSMVNNVSSYVNNASQSISQGVRNAANTVGQAINTAVSSVGNFFSGLFGGHK